MAKHMNRDLENLKKELLLVGSLVEGSTNKAILALTDRRPELADEVIELDHDIDDKEVHVEEECLKLLALHQPVAIDLRFLMVVVIPWFLGIAKPVQVHGLYPGLRNVQ